MKVKLFIPELNRVSASEHDFDVAPVAGCLILLEVDGCHVQYVVTDTWHAAELGTQQMRYYAALKQSDKQSRVIGDCLN